MTKSYVVTAELEGQRLDQALAVLASVSRTVAQGAIKEDRVAVNGASERPSYLVRLDDIIEMSQPNEPSEQTPVPDLAVIYQDDDLVVIDKPADIAVHPGNGRSRHATVADYARTVTTDDDPVRPGIVHRLDLETSGLLVIAKSAAAKQALQDQWRTRNVEKRYLALVVGRLDQDEAVIDLPLDRDPNKPTRRRVVPGGRPARTYYKVIYHLDGYTYVEAIPETGRTHQLRVHFAALGHPIAGDVIYGPKERPLGLKRQFLHATALGLTAPSGKRLELSSPLPPELQSILNNLLSKL